MAQNKSQWSIGSQYLQCNSKDMGSWCKKTLEISCSKTEFLTSHICEDICCTLSDCLFAEHFHSSIQYQQATTLLVFGIQGVSSFYFTKSQQRCTVREGDIWLISICNETLERSTAANLHSKMTVIKYSTERINRSFKSSDEIYTLISRDQMLRLGHQESPDKWIAELINNPMQSAADRLLAEARALELIARWIAPSNVIKDKPSKVLQEIVDLLTKDLNNRPSLKSLADMAGMSHTRLNREFKKNYGATVFNWLRNYRMQRAVKYLKDKHHSITDIAFLCGFSSASHFAQAFKKEYGYSPSRDR